MDKKELYRKAKEAYYSGSPIMSDEEFDDLEQELRESGDLVEEVGAKDKDAKYPHPTRMLSLSKFQADKKTGKAPTEEAMQWMAKVGVSKFEVTYKYDGNAANIIYENGKLKMALSRGDGKYGRDITSKLIGKAPETVPYDDILEVRGEVIMMSEVFDTKYAREYANPRNLVAGLLGRDDSKPLEDVVFVAYDAKHDGDYLSLDDICALGFNSEYVPPSREFVPLKDSFDDLFDIMVIERENSAFPLDGFVLKVPVDERYKFKENDHDPDWAKAIKFKPEGVVTAVEDIEWSMGKTGEYTPIACLKPVDLDGSVVRRACLYNAGYVSSYGIEKGTRVRIVKSGDIIPQIIEVFCNE